MSEWWTYRLSDFLMFSPRTYWRLVELYNRELWPVQLLALAAGLSVLGLAAARSRAARQAALALLAAAWLWVGWGFHWERYAQINWAARYLALAFAIQGTLLLACALSRRADPPGAPPAGLRLLGWALMVGAVLLYPATGLMAGRPWSQGEVFGLMPDPTALATVGWLLATRQRWRGGLAVIPLLSLLGGAATVWMLSNSQ